MASTGGMHQAGLRGHARGHQLGGVQSSVSMHRGREMLSIKSSDAGFVCKLEALVILVVR